MRWPKKPTGRHSGSSTSSAWACAGWLRLKSGSSPMPRPRPARRSKAQRWAAPSRRQSRQSCEARSVGLATSSARVLHSSHATCVSGVVWLCRMARSKPSCCRFTSRSLRSSSTRTSGCWRKKALTSGTAHWRPSPTDAVTRTRPRGLGAAACLRQHGQQVQFAQPGRQGRFAHVGAVGWAERPRSRTPGGVLRASQCSDLRTISSSVDDRGVLLANLDCPSAQAQEAALP